MSATTPDVLRDSREAKYAKRKFVNRLAITLAMAAMAFGLFWLFWILFETVRLGIGGLKLPITKVIAMVSPIARPRPSMMPPTTPALVYGNTTFDTTSQVVALYQNRRGWRHHAGSGPGDWRNHGDHLRYRQFQSA